MGVEYVPIVTMELCPVCEEPMYISSEGILTCYCGHMEPELTDLFELI